MDEHAYNRVEALVRLFREQRLSELRVEDGGFKLHLSRAHRKPQVMPAVAARASVAAARVEPRQRARESRTVAVRAPLIGVFYRAAAPDAPPFVEIGDIVKEGDTVCIVEAMKVFNEIKSEWPGRVVAIPTENGQLVQAGDPLMVLEFLAEGEAEEG